MAFIILFSLSACDGNWDAMSLEDAITIPENGIVVQETMQQIKDKKAIAVFTGKSGSFSYEWTIFGSNISLPGEINLGVSITQDSDDSVQIRLQQAEPFGFSATLSVHLNGKWNVQNASAYENGREFAAVSVTGSQTTVLNLSLDGSVQEFVIRPDSISEAPPATHPSGEKDKYQTDPIPEGKPKPVEPEDTEVNKGKSYTCTFSIECSTILNNLDMLDPDKLEMVPSGGVILSKTTVTFYEGESVFDVLQRVCKEKGIHMEAEWTPIYNSAYVEGIHNLYEFDCGALSGWMYRVNGWYPNYGSSRYQLKDGDVVEWRYTCDLGNAIGGGYAVGG